MKKLVLAGAALATIALGLPSIATAKEFSVRVGGDRGTHRDGDYRTNREFRGARAEYGSDQHDRGLHRGWYKDRGERTVIIKKRHRHWDD